MSNWFLQKAGPYSQAVKADHLHLRSGSARVVSSRTLWKAVLAAAGSDLQHVIKTTVFSKA
jgi:enamine deaminase RidA (YjgF/YER057c/UK114 family)